MINMTIQECVKEIQKILVDDIEMSMTSAKAINEQLKIILLLNKEKKNGS